MSYRRQANLRELLEGELDAKLNRHVLLADFTERPCNCGKSDVCPYLGSCRKKIVGSKANSKRIQWTAPTTPDQFAKPAASKLARSTSATLNNR